MYYLLSNSPQPILQRPTWTATTMAGIQLQLHQQQQQQSQTLSSIWTQMSYTPPRGPCSQRASLVSTCPCHRFMIHPLKAAASFDCDGCGHHACFHQLESKEEDGVVRRWRAEEEEEMGGGVREREREVGFAVEVGEKKKKRRRIDGGDGGGGGGEMAWWGLQALVRGEEEVVEEVVGEEEGEDQEVQVTGGRKKRKVKARG